MGESSQIKILGIVGSPRRGGNTEVLVDEILSGAEQAGGLTEKVILNELNLKPCQACNSCHKTGKCIQNDDMSLLEEKMENSHIWVLGTPIYWWGPTSQFKIFLDRWYGANNVSFKNRRVILVIPLGGGHEHYARHTIGLFEDVFDYLNMELFEKLIAPGVMKRGAVSKNKSLMEKAYRVGQDSIKA